METTLFDKPKAPAGLQPNRSVTKADWARLKQQTQERIEETQISINFIVAFLAVLSLVSAFVVIPQIPAAYKFLVEHPGAMIVVVMLLVVLVVLVVRLVRFAVRPITRRRSGKT